MQVCDGLLTMKSGATCHASALLREMGKVAITAVGYDDDAPAADNDMYSIPAHQGCMKIDFKQQALVSCYGSTFGKGAVLTLDGNTGNVYNARLPLIDSAANAALRTVMRWANQNKRMDVYSDVFESADIPRAINNGTDGIGLLATEYMFSTFDELNALQRFILSESAGERQECMNFMLPLQTGHILKAFQLMRHRPVFIRLLYPSLQYFMPENCFVSDTHPKLTVNPKKVLKISEELQELNPLLGCKGGRLSILYPELTAMQTKAILGEFTVELPLFRLGNILCLISGGLHRAK
jgi:pyruvate,orthophosphate dikinase